MLSVVLKWHLCSCLIFEFLSPQIFLRFLELPSCSFNYIILKLNGLIRNISLKPNTTSLHTLIVVLSKLSSLPVCRCSRNSLCQGFSLCCCCCILMSRRSSCTYHRLFSLLFQAWRSNMTHALRWSTAILVLLCLTGVAESKRNVKCPSGCTCSKDTVICVGASQIPRTIPPEISSL